VTLLTKAYLISLGKPHLCCNPSLGLVTKARVCKSAGQERSPGVWESVRMNTHTPKWTSIIGNWSPGGLPKLQRVITRVKTPRLVEFFISLKRYWNINVQNGIAWPIWTSTTQVMAKRKVRSRIGNLTPDHGKSGINPIPMCAGGVQHTLKSSQRGLQLRFRSHPDRRFAQEVIVSQSCGTPSLGDFGTPVWESRDKMPFGCHSCGEVQSILYGGRWWLPPSPGCGESCEFEVVRVSS
jgi:hypothetical protein